MATADSKIYVLEPHYLRWAQPAQATKRRVLVEKGGMQWRAKQLTGFPCLRRDNWAEKLQIL